MTVQIIFPPNLQTIITAQMVSIGGEGRLLRDGVSLLYASSQILAHIPVSNKKLSYSIVSIKFFVNCCTAARKSHLITAAVGK